MLRLGPSNYDVEQVGMNRIAKIQRWRRVLDFPGLAAAAPAPARLLGVCSVHEQIWGGRIVGLYRATNMEAKQHGGARRTTGNFKQFVKMWFLGRQTQPGARKRAELLDTPGLTDTMQACVGTAQVLALLPVNSTSGEFSSVTIADQRFFIANSVFVGVYDAISGLLEDAESARSEAPSQGQTKKRAKLERDQRAMRLLGEAKAVEVQDQLGQYAPYIS
jgi:hypothetical protein